MAELRGEIESLSWGGYINDDGGFTEDGHHRVTVRTDDDVRIGREPAVVFTGDSLATHDREVAARALHDAADELERLIDSQHPVAVNPDAWLRDRAIENGEADA